MSAIGTDWQAQRPLIIAHRGANRRAPENTLAAFRLALELGADGFELDTKLTADGEVVILHDLSLDRTTDGRGRVARWPAARLQELDAGGWFSPEFRGERIPRLDEVLQEFGRRTLVNIEISNITTPLDSTPEKVVSLVRKFGLAHRVLLSSFNPIALRRAAHLAPEIPGALLQRPRDPAWVRAVQARLGPHRFANLQLQLIDPDACARQRRAGRAVIAWTVNDPSRARELIGLGVAGLITDEPDRIREAVGRAAGP